MRGRHFLLVQLHDTGHKEMIRVLYRHLCVQILEAVSEVSHVWTVDRLRRFESL